MLKILVCKTTEKGTLFRLSDTLRIVATRSMTIRSLRPEHSLPERLTPFPVT